MTQWITSENAITVDSLFDALIKASRRPVSAPFQPRVNHPYVVGGASSSSPAAVFSMSSSAASASRQSRSYYMFRNSHMSRPNFTQNSALLLPEEAPFQPRVNHPYVVGGASSSSPAAVFSMSSSAASASRQSRSYYMFRNSHMSRPNFTQNSALLLPEEAPFQPRVNHPYVVGGASSSSPAAVFSMSSSAASASRQSRSYYMFRNSHMSRPNFTQNSALLLPEEALFQPSENISFVDSGASSSSRAGFYGPSGFTYASQRIRSHYMSSNSHMSHPNFVANTLYLNSRHYAPLDHVNYDFTGMSNMHPDTAPSQSRYERPDSPGDDGAVRIQIGSEFTGEHRMIPADVDARANPIDNEIAKNLKFFGILLGPILTIAYQAIETRNSNNNPLTLSTEIHGYLTVVSAIVAACACLGGLRLCTPNADTLAFGFSRQAMMRVMNNVASHATGYAFAGTMFNRYLQGNPIFMWIATILVSVVFTAVINLGLFGNGNGRRG
ncbi:hypothetical protein REPUB_Repub20aG0001900 [Reevesia pubescens]